MTQLCAHFSAVLIDGVSFTNVNEHLKHVVAVDTPSPKVDMTEMEGISEPQKKNVIEYIGFSGKDLDLYVLDNSFLQMGCFSAIQAKDMALLAKNDSFLNDCAMDIESAKQFHPRNEETCLALSAEDGRWYRAISHGRADDKSYNLMYLDYGNIEAVPFELIREMREEFFFPCITLHCFIDGLSQDQLRKEVVNRLHKLIPQYTKLTFDEVQFSGEDATCKSGEIMATLKNEKLI